MTDSKIEKLMVVFNAYALKRSDEFSREFGRVVDADHIRVAVYGHIIETMLREVSETRVKDMFSYIIKEIDTCHEEFHHE